MSQKNYYKPKVDDELFGIFEEVVSLCDYEGIYIDVGDVYNVWHSYFDLIKGCLSTMLFPIINFPGLMKMYPDSFRIERLFRKLDSGRLKSSWSWNRQEKLIYFLRVRRAFLFSRIEESYDKYGVKRRPSFDIHRRIKSGEAKKEWKTRYGNKEKFRIQSLSEEDRRRDPIFYTGGSRFFGDGEDPIEELQSWQRSGFSHWHALAGQRSRYVRRRKDK